MKLNAKQLAENLETSYVVATGLIKVLLKQKQIELAEKTFHSSGKGAPTKSYNFPEELIISIRETLEPVPTEVLEEVVVADATVQNETEVEPVPEPVPTEVHEEVQEEEEEVVAVAATTTSSEEYWYDDDDEDEWVDVD